MPQPTQPTPPTAPAITTYLPGIVVMLIVAAISFAINMWQPLISAMLIAILIGVAMRNLKVVPSWAEVGVKFSSKTILRLGVMLLGFRLALPDVLALGFGPILVIFITVIGSYLAIVFMGRLMKVPHTSRVLTATGTSICGAAAVAGMSAVVVRRGEQDEEIESSAATAIAIVTVFGTLSLIIFPIIGHAIGLNVHQLGVWLGAGIHEVGQVVAGAGLAGAALPADQAKELLDFATITKLGRVVTLAAMVAIVGYFESRNPEAIEAKKAQALASGSTVVAKTPILPLFVVGFLGAVIVRSIVSVTPLMAMPVTGTVFHYIDLVATLLLTVAMGAMGAGVHIASIIKSGLRAIVLGTLAAIFIACLSLGAVLLLVS